MAVATLAACYNNKAVFSSVVKIRKGQAVDLMMRSNNMVNVRSVFFQYIGQVGGCLCVSYSSTVWLLLNN